MYFNLVPRSSPRYFSLASPCKLTRWLHSSCRSGTRLHCPHDKHNHSVNSCLLASTAESHCRTTTFICHNYAGNSSAEYLKVLVPNTSSVDIEGRMSDFVIGPRTLPWLCSTAPFSSNGAPHAPTSAGANEATKQVTSILGRLVG